MIIIAETNYSLDGLKTFQRVAAKRINPAYYAGLRLVYLLAGAGAVAIAIYYGLAVARGDHDLVSIALALIGAYMGVQLLVMGVRYYDFFAKRAMSSIPERGHRNYFSFEGEQIVISNQGRSGSYSYTQFGDIYETKDYFLFYINLRNGYVLEKNGLKNASADQLRELLNSKREDPVIWLDNI